MKVVSLAGNITIAKRKVPSSIIDQRINQAVTVFSRKTNILIKFVIV